MEDKPEKRFESFKQAVSASVSTNLDTMIGLWIEMGVRNEEVRMDTVTNFVEKCFSKMIREEKGHIKSLELEIEELIKSRQSLLKELKVSNDGNEDEEDEELAKKSLIDIIDTLRERVLELSERKEEEMKSIRVLIQEDEEASRWVGLDPVQVPRETILDSGEVATVKRHVEDMRALRTRRLAQLDEMKAAVEDLCSVLGTEPSTALERKMVCEESHTIVLSEKNMTAVEQLVSRLQHQREANEELLLQFKSRIQVLCQRLELDDDQRREYLPVSSGLSDEAVKAVRDNLDRLEEKKRLHMKKFILSSKLELEEVWERMFYGQGQRERFIPYFSEEFTEEVLDRLDAELEKLKSKYERNKSLFEKVTEWHDVWAQSIDLENRAKDPNRLFNSRKNNLLQEEKEKKMLQRKLPKIEKELRAMVEEYDGANPDEPFTIKGMVFADYIASQKEEHGLEAYKEKATRMELRKRMLKQESLYGVKPLTPINKTNAMLMRSRRDLTKSVPGKRGQTNTLPSAKRRKLENDTIITGNLTKNTVQSVDATGLYRNDDLISSTFREEPRQTRGMKIPSTNPNLLTPNKTSTFKTPRSALRVPTSSKTLPPNPYGTRRGNLKKMPFKL